MAHSIKTIPDQGHPHLSLSRWWCCKGHCHTDAAGPNTGDGGVHPVSAVPCCHLQAIVNRKAQFTLVNLTYIICSLVQSTWHREAHIYFQFFYPSEVANSIQTAFWGWCLAQTKPHGCAGCCCCWFLCWEPPAQITDSVPWHHLAIGKENLDSICLILVQNWVFC